MAADGEHPTSNEVIRLRAVRDMGCIGEIGEICTRQRARYGSENRKAAQARIENADQAATTGILPIRACHSFGPVMCAEVPPESTATVTGMSTTSNS